MKWVKKFYEGFSIIPPMFLDGCIAVGIAFLTAIATGFAGEESYKYIHPGARWWVVLLLGATVQGMHALSKFRDGTFGRHLDAVQRKQVADEPAELVKKQQADEQEAKLQAAKDAAKLAEVKAELKADAVPPKP